MNNKRINRNYAYNLQGWLKDIIGYRVVVNTPNLLHSIRYTYSADRNRLSSINVTGTGIGSSSYQYDALGNLIRDNNENINVTWNVIGKVKSVQTPNNMLSFAYNPFGQRQIKRTASDSTYYIHDATGNVMSIYVKDYPKITAKERPIYGSSRLGIMNKEVEFNLTGNLLSKSNSTIGIKEYELCDHLSNVSVVVLDRKECTNSVIKPIVKSYTDYYPFGYPISTRTNNFDYTYGYNGQEKDNEVYGDGKSYTADFWQFDSRLGRRWNVDPEGRHWQSFYSTLSNNPVSLVDPKGNSDWKPDEIALENGEVRFIAQKGDNIQTLSVQTGIPVEQLETYYGGVEFIEGQSYSFEKIPVIQKMNLFLQNYNTSQYNCMYFAMFVNSVDAPNFETDKILIQNNFYNKSSISDATIGNIITYSESFEEFEFLYKAEAYHTGYDDESFRQYYISNFKYMPAHFAVVLLKTVDGKDIAYIIQKSGTRKVTYGIFPDQPKNYENGRDGIQLFQISPINEKDKTPIYEKNINN